MTVDKKRFNNENKAPLIKSMSLTKIQEGISRCITYGDGKYCRGNYHNAKDDMFDTYISATLRHLSAVAKARESGDKTLMIDKESGLPHTWHAAASLAIAIECLGKENK